MVLLVDAGNSRLKWSELDAAGNLSAQRALAYDGRPALDVFLGLLDTLPKISRITLVHVLTHLFAESAQEACAQRQLPLHIARSVDKAYGITSGYQQPHTLGADRFVGLVAAHQLAGTRASLVIDCGTAVTVDAVEKDGRHLGGVILPGLQLSADALISRAQNRLSLSFEQPDIFADGTARAIGSGCLFGLVGAIEGICARMQNAMSTPPVRILTGGDAEHLYPWLSGNYRMQPDLLMQGLRYITEQEICSNC
jgi:type III pantothenate kinase